METVVVEAAILLEAKWEDVVDDVWITEVSRDTAIARLMARNQLTEKVLQGNKNAKKKKT